MLCASWLSETHALRTQTLSAEPGGWVAARSPACGPALQPDTHAAASAATPNATTQIRLATANLPLPRSVLTSTWRPARPRTAWQRGPGTACLHCGREAGAATCGRGVAHRQLRWQAVPERRARDTSSSPSQIRRVDRAPERPLFLVAVVAHG